MSGALIYVLILVCCSPIMHSAVTPPPVPPRFVVEPQSSIVRPGSAVTLTCAVQPETANIRWTLNGSGVAVTSLRRRGVDVRDGMLRIGSYNGQQGALEDGSSAQTHDGIYQCVAVTQAGTIVSNEARLETAFLDRFDAGAVRAGSASAATEITVVEGNVAVVPCPSIPASKPAPVIEFEVNGARVTASGRHLVLPSGNLLIGNVSQVDGGVYRCSAYNTVLGSRTQSPVSHRLVVIAAAEATPSAPIVTWSSPDQVSVVQGRNLTIECSAHGFPVPQLSWEKYGGHLPAGRFSLLQGNLVIHSVQKFDAGTYLCKASNGVGHQQAKVIAVDVHEPAVIETAPSDQNATEGSTVVFKCRAQGLPKVTTQWLFNGLTINNEQFVSIRDTTLTLSNLQRRQSGMYQCVARNILGMTHAAARLLVVETLGPVAPPPTTRAPPPGRVQPPVSSVDDEEGSDYYDESEWDSDFLESAGVFPAGTGSDRSKRPEEKPGKPKENTQEGRVASPSRPEVSRVSDTSVLVRWSVVPPSAAASITMFKVQYRDTQERTLAAPWQTADEDIAPGHRSFEVTHLRPGITYRFRVVAVYANNDNKHGPSSVKITLGLDTSDQWTKIIVPGPFIAEARPLSVGEIFIGWQQPDTDRWAIEGFYIYYAVYNTEKLEYKRMVVPGSTVRHAVLSHLEAGTSYSIRMQSYTAAGTLSEYSNTVVKQTLASNEQPPDAGGYPASRSSLRSVSVRPAARNPSPNFGDSESPTRRSDVDASQSSVGSLMRNQDGQMLYIILSVVAGVIVIVIVACTIMCLWKKRQHKRDAEVKEQNRLEHADQATAFLGTHVKTQPNDEYKPNGSHVPGCAGGCNAAIAGLHSSGAIVHCVGCGPIVEPVDRNVLQFRPPMKKAVPELMLPPPPPLPPLPPAVTAYSQLTDMQQCAGTSQLHVPSSNINTASSPIYSKLLNHDDSMSSFDEHHVQPQRICDVRTGASHFASPDHIPRSHEVHPSYWVLEQNAAQQSCQGPMDEQCHMQQPSCWQQHYAGRAGPPGQIANVRNLGTSRPSHNTFGALHAGYDSATTVTSPAESCESLESASDIFSCAPVDVSDLESMRDSTVAGSTMRSDYENIDRRPQHNWVPDDSWKSLTEHVSGGGYQIRQSSLPMAGPAAPNGQSRRVNEYPPSDVDDYR